MRIRKSKTVRSPEKLSPFFSGIRQTAVRFGKYRGKKPIFFRDLSAMGALFTISAERARELLPSPCRPILIAPGIALASVACLEYRQSDIGPYNEVAIAIPTVAAGSLLPCGLAALISILKRELAVYLCQLPVSTEIATAGGVHFFAMPKYTAEIVFRETATQRICTLRDKKSLEVILEFDIKKLFTVPMPAILPGRMNIRIHGDDTAPQQGRMALHLKKWGWSCLLPNASLRWGRHPKAEPLKALRWGMPLLAIDAPEAEAILFADPRKAKA